MIVIMRSSSIIENDNEKIVLFREKVCSSKIFSFPSLTSRRRVWALDRDLIQSIMYIIQSSQSSLAHASKHTQFYASLSLS